MLSAGTTNSDYNFCVITSYIDDESM